MVPSTSGKTRLPCKILVHNLPETLPEEIFLKSIASFHPFINWHRYRQGKRQNPPQPNIPSFAYLKFKSESHVHDFFRFYQGHVFVDKDGKEESFLDVIINLPENVYRALLLVAPFQKVPPVKSKPDSLNGTIEDDPVFKDFVEKWNESLIPPPPPSPSHYIQNTSTPLLHYLAEKRGATGTSPKPTKSKKEKKQRSKKSKLIASPIDHSTGQPSQSLESKESVKQDSAPPKRIGKKKPKPKKNTKTPASSTSTADSTHKPNESAKAVPKKVSPKKKKAQNKHEKD